MRVAPLVVVATVISPIGIAVGESTAAARVDTSVTKLKSSANPDHAFTILLNGHAFAAPQLRRRLSHLSFVVNARLLARHEIRAFSSARAASGFAHRPDRAPILARTNGGGSVPSAYLYQHADAGGWALGFGDPRYGHPFGWQTPWIGSAYNDQVSSVMAIQAEVCLYEHINYGGRRLIIDGRASGGAVPWFDLPWYFNDITSSVKVVAGTGSC